MSQIQPFDTAVVRVARFRWVWVAADATGDLAADGSARTRRGAAQAARMQVLKFVVAATSGVDTSDGSAS